MCRAALVRPVSTSALNRKLQLSWKKNPLFFLLSISLRCKRYEKFPTAVLRTAVPYDYGGIDIIDELPLPSSKKTSEKKEEKEDNGSKTQSTISGPEEPSLRNVVTAAEDFIKVLATVSTSQSSTAGSERGETQSSEKKKKGEKTGKKKSSKKQKGKGRWKKNRKQKAEMRSKADEGTAASTSGSRGEVKDLSSFFSASHRHDPSGTHRTTEYEPVRKEEPLNEVMKDEPAMEKDTGSMTSTPAVEKKPETRTEVLYSRTTTVATRRKKTPQLRERGRKKTSPHPKEPLRNPTDSSVLTAATATGVSHPQQRSIGREAGNEPSVGPAEAPTEAPTVSPKGKRTRSKEGGDRQWRKKKRKDSSAPPTVPTPNENNPAEHLKAAPLGGTPAVPSDRNEGKTMVREGPRNTTFSVLKTHKLKEKGLRSSRRKAAKPPQNPESLIPPPPQTSASSRVSIAAASVPTEETLARAERLSPTTKAPPVPKNRRRQRTRGERGWRKRIRPPAVTDGVSVFNQTQQTATTFTSAPPKITTTGEPHLQPSDKMSVSTSASPILTPVQLSVERLKAQFNRKKRRKMAMRRQ